MSNCCDFIVECDNPAVIKECASALKDYDMNKCTGWKDGDTSIHTWMYFGNLHFDIEQISKHFQDDVITCLYNTDFSIGDLYISKFRNGERIHKSVQAVYLYNPIHLGNVDNERDRSEIYEKTVTFFRRIDTPVADSNGVMSINFVEDEIIYKFNHNGADGKKYEVEATKKWWDIDFKVHECLANGAWANVRLHTIAELDAYLSDQTRKVMSNDDLLEISGFKTWAEYDGYVSCHAEN